MSMFLRLNQVLYDKIFLKSSATTEKIKHLTRVRSTYLITYIF